MDEQGEFRPIALGLNHPWRFLDRKASARWLAGCRAGGRIVSLPHCWNAEDTFQEGLTYARGWGSYTRPFRVPEELREEGHAWFLEAEGFYGTGDVWLNGRRIAKVDGQYLGFSIDVSKDILSKAENTLGVRLTNRCSTGVLPGIREPDFLLYGGLSGRLFLRRRGAVYLDDRATRILTELEGATATLGVAAALRNASGASRECTVRCRVEGPGGAPVAESACHGLQLAAGASHSVDLSGLAITPVRRWQPDDPALYTVYIEVLCDGIVIDAIMRCIGLRHAEFRPDEGFFLNGERVELRGCNRHESMPGFGNALPFMQHHEDARILRDMGFNFVRLSHYPQHPAFLNACDELGIMVYAELASWKSVRTGRWLRAATRQLREMIERDRHRPSIILWGLGNESRSRKAYAVLDALAHSLDPTRPTIYAENHIARARREGTLGAVDVWGCNYEIEAVEAGRDAARRRCVLVSECCNYPFTMRGREELELKQIAQLVDVLPLLEDKPHVAGFALWCFNDYATLRKKRYRRYSGFVDAWRLPKLGAALLSARYASQPFLQVHIDWSECSTHPERILHVFTNCPSVTVERNGIPVCEAGDATYSTHAIDFQPGELRVRARRDDGGVAVRVLSYGVADGIRVTPERSVAQAVPGDVVGLRLSVCDGAGRCVLNFDGDVHVAVTGAAELRCFTASHIVPISAGIGRTFLASTGLGGRAEVRVTSRGLQPGLATVEFVPPPADRAAQEI